MKLRKNMMLIGTLAGILFMGSTAFAGDSQDLFAQIREKGTLTVGLEGNWAPWSYHDEEDKLVGFDADVSRAIAEKLGVEADIVEGPWESLFAGLDAGRYDIVVNGVEVTEERSEKYDFSTPYAFIRTALIVRTDNEEIKTFEDLDGKNTVNSLGSTYMELAESYGASALGVSTLDETLSNVLNGRADATLNADVSFYDYMSVHPDDPLMIVDLTEDASLVSIPVRKGEETDSFEEAVNQAIDELRADGTLAQLSVTYFGEDITSEADAEEAQTE